MDADWEKETREPIEGDRIEVMLSGIADESFYGTVLDRPRKLWAELDDPPFQSVKIADESNIIRWRFVRT